MLDVQREALVAEAEEMAFYNGEDEPESVQFVLTTGKAVAETGLMEVGDELSATDVFFVLITGDFIGYMAKVPEAEDLPTGKMIWFVMDAGTLELLAWGIEESPMWLGSLGEPGTLDVPVPISLDESTPADGG